MPFRLKCLVCGCEMQGAETTRSPRHGHEGANMTDVLAQLQRAGRIHFAKHLPRTAIHSRDKEETATLTLPAQFVRENGNKIEKRVLLRPLSSCGEARRPWTVRVSLTVMYPHTISARLSGGWYAFVAGNRLREGDWLIFVLKEDARSEFEVHMFRGPLGSPHFAVDRDSEEQSDNKQPRFSSPVHRPEEEKVSTRMIQQYTGPPDPLGYPRAFPCFCRRLSASNIGRSDRYPGSNTGQFEFPRSFLKAHGQQIQGRLKFQGIYEDSPIHVATCRRLAKNYFRVFLVVTEWTRFVKANHLQQGHELQFTLIADSYFMVRKI